MRDFEVRQGLTSKLREWHPEMDARFVEEMGISGTARIDLAVLSGALWAYEIKSSRDTLRRLPRQIAAYSTVADYATLVVADSHEHEALELIPPWWGFVIVNETTQSNLKFRRVKRGRRNTNLDPVTLAQMLWREEALDELATRGLDRGVRSKPRTILWKRIAEEIPISELRMIVRSRLKSRSNWRVGV